MKYLIVLTLTVILSSLSYFIGSNVGQLPEVIYKSPENDKNLTLWRKDWKKALNGIVTASVVSNSPEELHVYLDYIYSFSNKKSGTTCGSVLRNGLRGNWTCSPTEVRHGRGFTTLRFGVSSLSRSIECSDEIEINFYNQAGTFFEKRFAFKKTWIKGEVGIYGKIRETFSACPPVE